jgi:hypothetical protein
MGLFIGGKMNLEEIQMEKCSLAELIYLHRLFTYAQLRGANELTRVIERLIVEKLKEPKV